MTATSAPARSGPVTRSPGLAAARLLGLELRHNAMLWMMPVAIIRSSEVLPAPLGPSNPNTPGPARRSTPATAVVRPNRRVRPVISTFMIASRDGCWTRCGTQVRARIKAAQRARAGSSHRGAESAVIPRR